MPVFIQMPAVEQSYDGNDKNGRVYINSEKYCQIKEEIKSCYQQRGDIVFMIR